MRFVVFICLVFFNIAYATEKSEASLGIPKICANQCANCDQTSMNTCAAAYFKKADIELNVVYKKLISEGDSSRLRVAQHSWLKYRDTQCEYYAHEMASGGSMYPMVYSSCLADLTEKRVQELVE